MQLNRNISISGLIISVFVFMSAIVFLSEDERHYWTLLLFIPVLLFFIWEGIRKKSADMGE